MMYMVECFGKEIDILELIKRTEVEKLIIRDSWSYMLCRL